MMSPKKPTPMVKEFTKGFIVENPIFRLILGTCPTLAVTTSLKNGIGMGLAATFVLVGSNLAVSALRKVIPDKVRIPAFITIIAGFVTIVQMLMQTYLPALNAALGIYVPLITVNCIILARAEMFANKNTVPRSLLDGLGMGLGYTGALIVFSTIREVIGNGTIYDIPIPMLSENPMLILILPPGGFFVFGVLVAITQWLAERSLSKDAVAPELCATAAPGSSACAACGGCGLGLGASLNKELNAGLKPRPVSERSEV